jgi:DNA-binding transcriptional ArsR family regulator
MYSYEPQITLDRKSFKALASETRIRVLKALDTRQKTLSELSKALGMSKPTLLKHLERLIHADLIVKKEDHRKWVYYRITGKGKNILHPERVKIMVLLSTAVISLCSAIALALISIFQKTATFMFGQETNRTTEAPSPAPGPTEYTPPRVKPPAEPSPDYSPLPNITPEYIPAEQFDPLPIVAVVLFIVFFVLVAAAWFLKKRAQAVSL